MMIWSSSLLEIDRDAEGVVQRDQDQGLDQDQVSNRVIVTLLITLSIIIHLSRLNQKTIDRQVTVMIAKASLQTNLKTIMVQKIDQTNRILMVVNEQISNLHQNNSRMKML